MHRQKSYTTLRLSAVHGSVVYSHVLGACSCICTSLVLVLDRQVVLELQLGHLVLHVAQVAAGNLTARVMAAQGGMQYLHSVYHTPLVSTPGQVYEHFVTHNTETSLSAIGSPEYKKAELMRIICTHKATKHTAISVCFRLHKSGMGMVLVHAVSQQVLA